ncbi:MAG: GHKL domain-containing protein [Clostridium sp.]|uniref:sensor histidine kinase n=1 Tax=Clostridium sp. TaxID=1506 RepID=UPI002A74C48F|nr:GHKL domain-containing protein [Clostridium sp.]MCI6691125.1 GHKL domain-containing protein [Clostridium sp.]MDY2632472.1 GHKL domain-containing protein [Clostridium sp.]
MNIMLCFFSIIVHMPSIIFRYIPFSEYINKKQKKKLIELYAILLIINFIICLIVQLTIGIGIIFYNINILSFSILISVINSIIIKNMNYEHIFVFGVVETIELTLISFSIYVQELFNTQDIYIKIIVSTIILMVNFGVVYIPIKELIGNIFSYFSMQDSKNFWKNVWIVSNALFLVSLFLTPINKYDITLMDLISRVFIGIATLIICKGIIHDYTQSLKMEKILEQLHLQKNYYKALSDNVEKARKARHDLKYHISAITWFVENEEFDELKKYLEEYKSTYKINSSIPYTGSSAIDGIVYHYMEIANEYGVRFEVNCSFNNLRIQDVDLCTLLGNSLENAITASKNVEGDKFISLYSENDDYQFVLIVDNSFDGIILRKNGKIISKKNNEECGIGISSMESICKKYNGYCTFEAHNNVFHSSFILSNGIDK